MIKKKLSSLEKCIFFVILPNSAIILIAKECSFITSSLCCNRPVWFSCSWFIVPMNLTAAIRFLACVPSKHTRISYLVYSTESWPYMQEHSRIRISIKTLVINWAKKNNEWQVVPNKQCTMYNCTWRTATHMHRLSRLQFMSLPESIHSSSRALKLNCKKLT